VVAKKQSPLALWLGLALVVLLVDQLTKQLVERAFKYGERLNVVPNFFDLTLLYNKGAAFSFLASAGGWQRWFFIGIGAFATVFLLYLLIKHGGQKLFSFGLCMILGGAIGNVLDRIWHGHVIDFLLVYKEPYFWPAFNVADSAITLGAACLIVDELRRVRQTKKS
jgi:signal peptidase II